MITLENWGIVTNATPYMAPEMITSSLHGLVSGHPRAELNGKYIHTSPIVGLENGCIVTKSGSRYVLGNVAPEYEAEYPNARERLINSLL